MSLRKIANLIEESNTNVTSDTNKLHLKLINHESSNLL